MSDQQPNQPSAAPAAAPQPRKRGPGGGAAEAPANVAPANVATPRRGAPAANGNALKSGRFARPELQAVRFELGGLSKDKRRVERQSRAFRAALEGAVLAAHGKISILHALAIQTAARHERHGLLCLAWLRGDDAKDMSHGERLAYSKSIADSSAARDKAIDKLGLDCDPTAAKSLWATLDAEAREVDRQDAEQPLKPTDAAASKPEALAAAEGGHSSPSSAGPAADPATADARIPLVPIMGSF